MKNNLKKNNGWHELYKKGFRAKYPNEDVIRFIQRNFPEKEKRNNFKVLDFGFGTGRHVIYLAKEGFNVFGVETARAGIKLTEKWLKQEGLRADLKEIDGIKLPFPDGYFDAIIDCAAVQHNRVAEIKDIILEMRRVLKKGGVIFSFCKSTEDSLYGLGKKIENSTFYYKEGTDTYTLIHFFTKKEIKSLWGKFQKLEIENTKRTIENMSKKIAHFIVSAEK